MRWHFERSLSYWIASTVHDISDYRLMQTTWLQRLQPEHLYIINCAHKIKSHGKALYQLFLRLRFASSRLRRLDDASPVNETADSIQKRGLA